jgi:cobalt-zinc-cadmium resistance protein CzcA
VVGINVRNRDLQSVVTDIQKIVTTEIKLPTGYCEYGGQFENLQKRKSQVDDCRATRLIIFILLYFLLLVPSKKLLMVYSMIPLSAVGGVLFLYMRGLPFSISAGVGFIAQSQY